MRFLLINSPLFREEGCLYYEDTLPPIGLGYIATYLKNNKVDVELIDAVSDKIPLDKLKKIINEIKPDFLAINIFTTNYDLVKELIESLDTKTHIIIGGLATKELNHKIIEWKTLNQIDVVIGDGEQITLDIIKNSLKEDAVFSNQSRRVFKVSNGSVYYIKNISDVLLDRSFFKNEPTKNHAGLLEANIITGRGCIYNCSFCAAARMQNIDFPLRERTEDSIINELNSIKNIFPVVNSIRILDDLFLKTRNSLLRATNIFTRFNFHWRSMAHIKVFSEATQKEINALKESGCDELFIGMESGSPSILKTINKTDNIEQIVLNLSKIFKAKINVKGYFIYGFPDETEHDMVLTYELASEIKELSMKYGSNFRTSVFQFRPYHGTEIFNKLKEKNINIEIEQTIPNQDLSDLIGRNQFNFHRGNYSKVCLETIHDYICRTNNLNE
ncbi:MAG: radical SAM protein [Bacteroidales bacterium]